MATPADIFFVGLCSFLNLKNDQAQMPPPSVMLHATKGSMKHIAYIAYDPAKVKLEDAANFTVKHTANGFDYVELNGEELTLNDDWSAPPRSIDASYDYVAHIAKYSGIATPMFSSHIPQKGHTPTKKHAAAYLEFGKGDIRADWPTEIKWEFRNGADKTDGPAQYMRRVAYHYDVPDRSIIVLAEELKGTGRRKMVFTYVTGALEIWIGNSMPDKNGVVTAEDLTEHPNSTPAEAKHFKYFYKSLKGSPKTFLPNPAAGQNLPTGGEGTGYCGPDGQP